ncbi:MAG: hydrophobic protein [Candidatus Dormibacteria bacterium]
MGTALLVLLLILVLFGAGGMALHFLWFMLVAALVIWAVGFFIRGAEGGGRWYRW